MNFATQINPDPEPWLIINFIDRAIHIDRLVPPRPSLPPNSSLRIPRSPRSLNRTQNITKIQRIPPRSATLAVRLRLLADRLQVICKTLAWKPSHRMSLLRLKRFNIITFSKLAFPKCSNPNIPLSNATSPMARLSSMPLTIRHTLWMCLDEMNTVLTPCLGIETPIRILRHGAMILLVLENTLALIAAKNIHASISSSRNDSIGKQATNGCTIPVGFLFISTDIHE
jgi:hypothetical protein